MREVFAMEYRFYLNKKILTLLNLLLILGVAGVGTYNVFFVQVNDQPVIQKAISLPLLTLLFFWPNIFALFFFKTHRGRTPTIVALAVWTILCAIGLVSIEQTTFVIIICSLLIFVNVVSLIGVSTSKQRSSA